MAKNYSITFKSLRAGTVYTLNIGGGTGNAVPLKGGAQPFVTQEDDDDDQFTPIRTQSGYIRIIDDGFAADGTTAFDWKDLVPDTDLSRPVTLTAVDAQALSGRDSCRHRTSAAHSTATHRRGNTPCSVRWLLSRQMIPMATTAS